jgi:hypothetical protein
MKESQQPKPKVGGPRKPERAILEIARALARQAAREDHKREKDKGHDTDD